MSRLDLTGADRTRWVAAPPPAAIPEAARRTAEAHWAASDLTPGPDEVRHFADVLTYVMEKYPRVHPGFDLHFHLDSPRGVPLAVYAAARRVPGADPADPAHPQETEDRLRALTCADDTAYAVEPPLVEEFATARLGTGIRVLRHITDPGGGNEIVTGLRYAWHVEEYESDVVLLTSAPDTARVLSALDDIDAFARMIRLHA